MRFLAITYSGPDAAEPTPEALEGMGKLMEEGTRDGWMVETGAVHTPGKGTKVRYSGGQFTVTDGPFAEAKELIAGYAIMKVDSKEEALALSKRFYEVMGDGEGELLQMFGGDEFDPQSMQC